MRRVARRRSAVDSPVGRAVARQVDRPVAWQRAGMPPIADRSGVCGRPASPTSLRDLEIGT
jgi:hypothetical protein